jgi:cytochrome P450
VDVCNEQEYLTRVMLEALRIMPPIPGTSGMHFLEDCTAGGHKFKKGDTFSVINLGLHKNPDEW